MFLNPKLGAQNYYDWSLGYEHVFIPPVCLPYRDTSFQHTPMPSGNDNTISITILRLLRHLCLIFIRIGKILWSQAAHVLVKFIQRFLKQLSSPFISNQIYPRPKAPDTTKGGNSSHLRGQDATGARPAQSQKHATPTEPLAFSLLPRSSRDRVATPPTRSGTPSSSVDVQSLYSDRISIMLQPPQSPSTLNSPTAAIGGIELEDPGSSSPRSSIQHLGSQTNGILAESHLDAPRRSIARPTSTNSRPRSISPGGRSSISGRPPSSYSQFHPHVPSKLGLSRPQTPTKPALSLRPIPSRISLASRTSRVSARFDRPSSVIREPEPEPLPIIEPEDLPEHFEDPEERIWPIAPEDTWRYQRRIFASKKARDITLKPMTMRFEAPWNPEGWQPIVHPEGQMYFWHSEKRVLTEAYLYDKTLYGHIEEHLATLEEFIDRLSLRRILVSHDLVLDLQPDGGGNYYCGYYFANHKERSVFWLQPCLASQVSQWNPEAGHKSKLHLKHAIETQYWYTISSLGTCIIRADGEPDNRYHCAMFPTTFDLKIEHTIELRDTLLHYIADSMLSSTSIAPYRHDDLNKMLSWVNGLEKNIATASVGSTSMLARLMQVFTRERFLHFYGEPAVRLYRGVSVYGTVRKRTPLIRLISPILFAAPLQHLIALEQIWVDEIVHDPTWKVLIEKFNKQWEEFILFATVMLNANVALLSVQTLDTNDPLDSRKPAQIAAYLSIVASIGSILIGLLLIKMNRIRLTETAPDALRFLDSYASKVVGLEMLAILYSLPFAFLMWGMIGFLFAFCFLVFQDTTLVTRSVVGVACVITGLAVAWCIWIGWDKTIHLQPEVVEPTMTISVPEYDELDEAHSGSDKASTHPQDTAHHGLSIVASWNRTATAV
ncbi:hypothetical protein NP233_g12767 [Leucocoprinus birnbaumii]|uniref:Uncharacterized protein n=1 Tax=Leucocoprinus birnbaumii TaxID=56174 RepID=A0AAD5VE94_9AGAR|nr:hypothetical protein NP233_g12767 [Leucocoprinus birnbaumii]